MSPNFKKTHDSVAESKPFQQYHAPTSSYDDREVDEFYKELQSLVNQIPK